MAADVDDSTAAFLIGAVRPLFEVRYRTAPYLAFGPGSVYDVTADGRRFLVNTTTGDQETAAPIAVVTDWRATLRNRCGGERLVQDGERQWA